MENPSLLPYRTTWCYLPPDIGERVPSLSQSDRPI